MAVVAILLLFIAPDISKTLEHQRLSGVDMTQSAPVQMQHSGNSRVEMDAMGDDMHHMHTSSVLSADASPADPHQHLGMPDEGGMMDDFSCGYCQLLVHFPLLLWLFIPLIWLLFRLASGMPVRRYVSWFPSAFLPGIPQPRAPPAC